MDVASHPGKTQASKKALGRHRSISSSGPAHTGSRSHPSSPVNFMPPGSHQVPIASLYQNVTVPSSSCPFSYPSSPVMVSHAALLHNSGIPASNPVLHVNAQLRQSAMHRNIGETKPIREAVLHSKTVSVAKSSGMDKHPKKESAPRKPKMHLYASRKSAKNEPKEEDFPVPPDNWLLGSNSTGETSSSSSETQSGNVSEDDYDEDGVVNTLSNFETLTSVMAARSMDTAATCQMLSMGLKALLKVSA
ncbi:eukaryotic translation initiation factor 4E-binding protein Mextli homolog [Paramacrobiotus metropolitanus]|uniref:eukaryotic translation initiation factor 4E-binding protein Mextli homolog n=1 Tax=Paramacrobiotus metropolitanus TaxID=2943436 RepID=UPI0024456B1F|nr:eukaryotic translation initiation factor 4E-binding protein Mextli homolog [Paramacrobiotus metropolitanus]